MEKNVKSVLKVAGISLAAGFAVGLAVRAAYVQGKRDGVRLWNDFDSEPDPVKPRDFSDLKMRSKIAEEIERSHHSTSDFFNKWRSRYPEYFGLNPKSEESNEGLDPEEGTYPSGLKYKKVHDFDWDSFEAQYGTYEDMIAAKNADLKPSDLLSTEDLQAASGELDTAIKILQGTIENLKSKSVSESSIHTDEWKELREGAEKVLRELEQTLGELETESSKDKPEDSLEELRRKFRSRSDKYHEGTVEKFQKEFRNRKF